MSINASFKFDTGWQKLQKALHYRQIRENVSRALALNAKLVEKRMRSELTRGVPPRQSALQKYIKGSSKPGIDHADMWKAITSQQVKPDYYFIGVLRTSDSYNVAEIVHNGAVMTVTPAMRGLFFMLWLVDSGRMDPAKLNGRAAELYERRKGEWKPLRPGTSRISIPARRFVARTMADQKLKQKIKDNFTQAIAAALSGKPAFGGRKAGE